MVGLNILNRVNVEAEVCAQVKIQKFRILKVED